MENTADRKPEVIRGNGEFKAGLGPIVTEWHKTRKGAVAAYYRHLKAYRAERKAIVFAGVELTPETMQRTREHFAQIYRDCIAEAQSGAVFVNDLASYVAWHETLMADCMAGKDDHTFTFLQRAHYLQTGESVPMLPKW